MEVLGNYGSRNRGAAFGRLSVSGASSYVYRRDNTEISSKERQGEFGVSEVDRSAYQWSQDRVSAKSCCVWSTRRRYILEESGQRPVDADYGGGGLQQPDRTLSRTSSAGLRA